MTKEPKKILCCRDLVAYAYFSIIDEEDISRFVRHIDLGTRSLDGVKVEVFMIGKVEECVHTLTDLGDDSDVLIGFLVEVSFESWLALLREYPNRFTEKENLSHVLRLFFQQEDWDSLFRKEEPLRVVANKMMSYFSRLELMDWWDVVEYSQGKSSRLDVFVSFRAVVLVLLNIYADNIAFDAEEDREDINVLRSFIEEIMTEK